MNETGLLWLAALVIAFLSFRVVVLWYWRVNAIHDRLTEIRNELRLLRAADQPTNTTTSAANSTNGTASPRVAPAPRPQAPVDRLLGALRSPLTEGLEPAPRDET